MKKAQISFEYVLLFSFALLIFIVIGTLIVSGLEKTRQFDSEAKYLVKEIKSATIIASLSESDFSTTIEIPKEIAGKKIKLDLYGNPDNLVRVWDISKDPNNPEQIAAAFLPIIQISNSDNKIENKEGGKLIISKFVSEGTQIITISE